MNAPAPVTVRLRRDLARALQEGHPWVYRDALEPHSAPPGAVVTVLDARGRFVARGLADAGPLAVRVFTTRDETLGPALLAARFAQARALRARVVPAETDAYRLVHGEGDRLPGLVCDVYGPYAVLRLDGAGALAWRDAAVEALVPTLRAVGVRGLLVRHGRAETRTVEAAWGEAVPARVSVKEHGMTLLADLHQGQKTGLFLDQRGSRQRVRALARGLRALNLYGYTGGFSVAAGLGDAARVTTVDIAPAAVALATETWAANGLDPSRHEAVAADVPAFLAAHPQARWELVVADPPSFAPNEAALPAALKSYRALHTACLARLAPGGFYLAGSCSSHVTREAFLATLTEAAGKARRVLQVVDAWGAPGDHPTLAAFPEGGYLKNVLCRVLE